MDPDGLAIEPQEVAGEPTRERDNATKAELDTSIADERRRLEAERERRRVRLRLAGLDPKAADAWP